MKINPLKIEVYAAFGKSEGTVAFDGEKFVYEAAEDSRFNGEAWLRKRIEWMKDEIGVENPSPEELFRFIVLRSWGRMNGAYYAPGDGPELSQKDIRRGADDLIRQILRRSREERQKKSQATEGPHRDDSPATATGVDGRPDRPEYGDEDQPAEDRSPPAPG